MKFELKPLSHDGIQAALEKAQRYRLLNEPMQAESICMDILKTDPQNKEAKVTLILALTDQFGQNPKGEYRARELVSELKDPYDKDYYNGIICERRGNAALKHGFQNSNADAFEWFRTALEYYESAQSRRPAGNDASILRWNACVRVIEKHRLAPHVEDGFIPMQE